MAFNNVECTHNHDVTYSRPTERNIRLSTMKRGRKVIKKDERKKLFGKVSQMAVLMTIRESSPIAMVKCVCVGMRDFDDFSSEWPKSFFTRSVAVSFSSFYPTSRAIKKFRPTTISDRRLACLMCVYMWLSSAAIELTIRTCSGSASRVLSLTGTTVKNRRGNLKLSTDSLTSVCVVFRTR